MSHPHVCGIIAPRRTAAGRLRVTHRIRKIFSEFSGSHILHGSKTAGRQIAAIANAAVQNPQTWTDVSKVSDADFLAMLRQGKRGR